MNDTKDPAVPEDTPVLEIERKYLLDRLPDLPSEIETLHIEQGYLPDEDTAPNSPLQHHVGRLRQVKHADGSMHYWHTIKRGEGLVRDGRQRLVEAADAGGAHTHFFDDALNAADLDPVADVERLVGKDDE